MHGSKKEPCQRAPRVNIRSYQIAYLNFQSGNGGIVLDVSASGLGFQAVEPLRAEELLLFRLAVPGLPHINLSGYVAWLDESRKRGGLRVIVPATERRAFQLWQQQWLGSQLEASEPRPAPRAAELVPELPAEAKQSRASRNVLVACLLVTLCVALADGSQLVSAARRVGDLLSHVGGRSGSGTAQAVSAPSMQESSSLAQNSPRPAPAVAPRVAAHRGYPKLANDRSSRLFAAAASQTKAGKNLSHIDPVGAERVSLPPPATSRSAPQLIAKSTIASPNRTLSKETRKFDSPPYALHGPLVHRQPHARPKASALAASIASRNGRGTFASSDGIAAGQADPTNTGVDSSSGAAVLPAASQPAASAAEPADALSLQTPEPAENLQPCQLVSSVQPAYPQKARKQRVEGDVKLRLVVGADGAVRSVAPLLGPPLLVAAALDAARQFRYKPALLNGKPIATIQTVNISFKLER